MQLVTLRCRKSFRIYSEWVHELFSVLLAAAQFVACFGFFTTSSMAFYESACWVFFWTSAISAFLAAHGLYESWHGLGQLSAEEKGKAQREHMENGLFTGGNLMFAVGSILFLPGVYEHDERNDLEAGTWLFLLGSFSFLVAAFVNSLGVSVVGTLESQTHMKQAAVLALGLEVLAGTLFITGSVLFFPQIDDASCGAANVCKMTKPTWPVINVGTAFYVIGAGCGLVGAVTGMYLAIAKKKHTAELAKIMPDGSQSS